MSVRDYFSNKTLSSAKFQDEVKKVESLENVEQQITLKKRFIPDLDYATASNFSYFGSAKEYYLTAIENIANTYPYDGSKKEIAEFLNESNYVDLYLFENKYPRFNGYATISSQGWGSLVGSQVFGLGKPDTLEYIILRGGPNTASVGMDGKPIYETFDASNKYETEIYNKYGQITNGRVGSRESNLKTNFDNGISVEFWLKKDAFDATKTETEIIFDLWNGTISGTVAGINQDTGRFILAISDNGAAPDEGMTLLVQSGSTQLIQTIPGIPVSTVSDGNWHHYAVVAQNSGSSMIATFYLDGQKKYTLPAGSISNLGEITGSLIATIGAAQTGLPVNDFTGIDGKGYGKLSGSLDEFRFWKSARTQEQIVDNYATHVGGGSNTDVSNAELGVYYKFNEGITGTGSVDSVVLDYSGRITNGSWVGYPGSVARSTGSAIVESGIATKEFKDPVIYKTHPDYLTLYNELQTEGEFWDNQNPVLLRNSIPAWIYEADPSEETNKNLSNISQIMGNVFDTIYLQAREYGKIKNPSYGKDRAATLEGVNVSGSKVNPYAQVALENYGLDTNELFLNQTLTEYITNRNLYKEYSVPLEEIKNTIYRNIYNNLIKIYKSKGTAKSIRNLMRCIGINDSVLRLKTYSNNNEFLFNNKYQESLKFKKFINFNTNQTFGSSIFQSASLTNPNNQGASSVTGSLDLYQAFTSEISIRIPNRLQVTNDTYYIPTFLSSSVFGLHQTSSATTIDYPLNSSNDSNFQLYVVKSRFDETEGYFALENRANTFRLTSSIYKDLFDNSQWNLAVRVYSNKYPYSSTGSNGINHVLGSHTSSYTIELLGFNTEGSLLKDSFKVKTEIESEKAKSLLTGSLRYYVGAHRENFTGSLLQSSDIEVGSLRHYATFVSDEALKVHSYDNNVFGVENPTKNKYLFSANSNLSSSYVPEHTHVLFNIDFETLTGSDSNGKFTTVDFSSGSVALNSRYPQLRNMNSIQYGFTGYNFPANSTSFVEKRVLLTSKLSLPEEINDDNFVNILDRDDELFTRDNLVFSSNMALEKSYYGAISDEMINFFGGIVEFNNLIGEVMLKYKEEYKALNYLKTIFFEQVGDISRIEKFYSYYKWIDDSITNLVNQLIPESMIFENNIRDLIESHIFERNKIKYNYPLIDYRGNSRFEQESLEGNVKGISELRRSWKYESPPLSLNQQQNVSWWKNLAIRRDSFLSSGNTTVDNYREIVRKLVLDFGKETKKTLLDKTATKYEMNLSKFSTKMQEMQFTVQKQNGEYFLASGVNSKALKNIDIFKEKVSTFTKNRRNSITLSRADAVNIYDESEIQRNVKVKFNIQGFADQDNNQVTDDYFFDNAETIMPISFVSESRQSSELSGYQSNSTFKHQINNLHGDHVGRTMEVPMQSPFTQEHVGGNQHRHQGMQTTVVPTSAQSGLRSEQFKITRTDANTIRILSPQANESTTDTYTNLPYSVYYRDETAKRPVNLRNIKYTTSSYAIGNYKKDYEIISAGFRSVNNRAFVKSEGFGTGSLTSSFINGMSEYAKPIRTIASATIDGNKNAGATEHIIVTRFSAPGGPETSGDNQGGLGLDYESAEFSPYNNLNYRNITVRQPLNRSFLNSVSYKYGLASGSTVGLNDYQTSGSTILTASYHKTHRNGRKVVYQTSSIDFVSNLTGTKVVYDNAFVSTVIPGSDLQYNWITSSYSQFNILNFQSQDGLVSTSVGMLEEIVFVTQSSLGSAIIAGNRVYGVDSKSAGYSEFRPDTIGRFASNIQEPVDATVMNLGYSLTTNLSSYIKSGEITNSSTSQAYVLNGLLNYRNGVYGQTTFRQIRNSENPIVKSLNKNNLFTFNTLSGDKRNIITIRTDGVTDEQRLKDKVGQVNFYTQSVYTNRYQPIDFYLVTNKSKNKEKLSIADTLLARAEHGNDKIFFDIKEIDQAIGLTNKRKTPAEVIINTYSTNKNIGIYQIDYKETVYPNCYNSGLKRFRTRTNYSNNFWKDDIADRVALGLKNKNISATRPGINFERSLWDLDPTADFLSTNYATTYVNHTSKNASPSGILQNGLGYYYTAVTNAGTGVYGTSSLNGSRTIQIEPLLARPTAERSPKSLVSANGMKILLTDGTELRDTATNSTNEYIRGAGIAKWEAPEQSEKLVEVPETLRNFKVLVDRQYQKTNRKPFYNSYEEFSEDLGLIGRDMSLLPEFRVSQYSDRYIGTKNISQIPDFLKIDGASEVDNSLGDKFFEIYSNTDFLKYFKPIKNSNNDFVVNDSLTLECNIVKKFIPYNGFYPSERSVEIVKSFFDSYADSLNPKSFIQNGIENRVSDTNQTRPLAQTLFAPGILYNTIKSGLAVDYPIYTSQYTSSTRYFENGGSDYDRFLVEPFDSRVPFEAIYKPSILNNTRIYDNEPLENTRIGTNTVTLAMDVSIPEGNTKYVYAINNFLAETQNFFLEETTKISSAPANQFNSLSPGAHYAMRIKMFSSLERPLVTSGSWGDYPIPQASKSVGDPPIVYLLANKYLFQGPYRTAGARSGGDRFGGDYETLINLTASITLNDAASGSTIIIGTGTLNAGPEKYSNNTFAIDATRNVNNYGYDTNLSFTLKAMANAINSSSLGIIGGATGVNKSFKATYIGEKQIRSINGNDDIIGRFGETDLWEENPETYTYGIVKIEGLDYPYNTLTTALSLSSPTNFDHEFVNQFMFLTSSIPTEISPSYVTSSLTSVGGGYRFTSSMPYTSWNQPRQTEIMYSRPSAFGPPVAGVTGSTADQYIYSSGAFDSARGYNFAFTPPYYHGESWMDVVYVPEDRLTATYRPTLGSSDGTKYNLVTPVSGTGFPTYDGTTVEPGLHLRLWRYDKADGINTINDNVMMRDHMINSNSMQLTASIYSFNIEDLVRPSDNSSIVTNPNNSFVDAIANAVASVINGDTSKWVIKPKFETPILNFSHFTGSNIAGSTSSMNQVYAPDSNNGVYRTVPRGIWHQFGRIPAENEGIYLQVDKIPEKWLDNHPSGQTSVANGGYRLNSQKPLPLNELLKFPATPKKLGQIAKSRKVREAIVAIPFVEKDGAKEFFLIDDTQSKQVLTAIDLVEAIYFSNNSTKELLVGTEEFYEFARNINSNSIKGDTVVGNTVVGNDSILTLLNSGLLDEVKKPTSISEMFVKMRNYNFPPQFDFLSNRDINPISMYIFEFEHTFDQNDLSHIWQNLMPELGIKAERSTSTISHYLLTNELLGNRGANTENNLENVGYVEFPSEVRWMVFKVKQKALKDFEKLSLGKTQFTQQEKTFAYNWPYDYFSFVELASLKAGVGLKATRSQIEKTTSVIPNQILDLLYTGETIEQPPSVIGSGDPGYDNGLPSDPPNIGDGFPPGEIPVIDNEFLLDRQAGPNSSNAVGTGNRTTIAGTGINSTPGSGLGSSGGGGPITGGGFGGQGP